MASRHQEAGQANSPRLLDPLARLNPLRQVVQVADGPAIADGVRAAAHAGQVGVVAASILL